MAMPAPIPMTPASVMPSMKARPGISSFMRLVRSGLRSEPIYVIRGSRCARLKTISTQAGRISHAPQRFLHLLDHVGLEARLVMPFRVVLGEVDALALHRMADHRGRTTGQERRALEHVAQRIYVVPVDLGGRESEALPLVHQRLE